MTALKVFVIRCDRCAATFESRLGRESLARGEARAVGWTRPMYRPERSRMRIDVCPGCSEGKAA